MKRFIVFLLINVMVLSLSGQVPAGINYQAVVRDVNGNIKVSQPVTIEIEILKANAEGSSVFKETFDVQTNSYGLVNLVIGSKNPAEFANLDWSQGPYFIRLILDHVIMGTSQLQSVPYALYSLKSGSSTNFIAGDGIEITNGIIKNTAPAIPVSISGQDGLVVEGNYPDFKISNKNANHVILVSQDNFMDVSVNEGDILQVDGNISLGSDLNWEAEGTSVFGGEFSGDGSQTISLANNTLINGTHFSNVGIDSHGATFINCLFTGQCQKLGYDARYFNCRFTDVTCTSESLLGRIESSEISNCTFPRVTGFFNSTLSGSIIGSEEFGGFFFSNCKISKSEILAMSGEIIINSNKFTEVDLLIGSPGKSPTKLMVSNNIFSTLRPGFTEFIRIDPSYASYRIWSILNNTFALQPSDPQSINITGSDASPAYSVLNIQGNYFFKGLNSLQYDSDMKIIFSNNVGLRTEHPTSSGNLMANNNYNF